MPASEFLSLRRDGGLTHVIDKGIGLRAWEDVLETSGEYIDIVKLGWGTAYVTPNLQRKLDVLKGKPVVFGGTFFEAVYAQGKLDDYKRWLGELGIGHVEISDGVVDLPRERKLELIADFARNFTVLSEVGSKDAEAVFAPYQWVEWIKAELEAGAWKVITEGRGGGKAGIYRPTCETRTGLGDEIAHAADVSALLFEAPSKASQAWFVKQFGPGVNLGNIPPEEVIPLETLRLGLRADTLREVLLGDAEPAPSWRRDDAGRGRPPLGVSGVRRPALPDVLVAEAVVGARAHGLRARARHPGDRARHAALLPRELRDTRPADRALRPAPRRAAARDLRRGAAPAGGPEPLGDRPRPLLPHPPGRGDWQG